MKHFKLLAVALLCITVSLQTQAQRKGKRFSFGFGIEAASTADKLLKDTYSVGGGLSFRFSAKLGPGFLTAATGATAYVPKDTDGDEVKVGVHIPFKVGYKYIFARHFFVMGEGGYSYFRQSVVDDGGEKDAVQHNGFIVAPSAGVQFGVFELAFRYDYFTLKQATLLNEAWEEKNKGVGVPTIRVGFNF
ncbi:hypothetical protein LX64_04639 [Chitinophaga skermanii]|uniref:Outer membrane protein with beta-barrel domain n=1 Tax=Chitinophaga skermanii TaxID=331697 RepID=A0A327Q406_9BACT|nr:hypothetical protein [Chitinophaga skermanii]RAI98654.1 hypothetical protein LX64_04639 [Chitinophaga skermanii]